MMTETEYLMKLNNFQDELEGCQSKESFKKIEERLHRKLKEVFLDNDPFVNRCKSSWGASPKALANLSSAIGNGYNYVSDYEEKSFHDKELSRNLEKFKSLLSEIIETINKDGLPFNAKTSMIINVKNSPGANVAANNMGNTGQNSNITISGFNKYYPQAIEEINQSDELTKDQREELLDMLELFKESIDKEETPKKTILKTLANYSLYATSIGANMVTLWGFIEPYINQLPK